MATLTKTIQSLPITLQSVAAGAFVASSDIDVSTKLSAAFHIHFGRRATTALTVGCKFRIEARAKASGNGHWFTVAEFLTGIATSETEAVTGTVASGQKVITCASTTNLLVGQIVYVDNGTIANSEWVRLNIVTSNTSVTTEDNLVNAQTSSNMFNQAQIFFASIDCAGIQTLRVVVDNSGTGQAIAAEVECITCDSLA